MDDEALVELQEVMEDVEDVSSQTDALSDESDEEGENSEEPEEYLDETALREDSATNNPFVQVIQPEDIGDASDADGAPVMSASCVCN